MSEARIGELLRDMEDSVLTIKGFIDDNEDLHQIQRSHQEPREAKRKKITNSFHMIRKQANILFRAILCCWGHDCHERHHAMLRLEDRCQDYEHNHGELQGRFDTVKFRLLFPQQHMVTPESSSWQESLIVTIEEDSCTLLNRIPDMNQHRNTHGISATAHTKTVTFKTAPEIVVTSTETTVIEASAPNEVTSICKSLTEARPPIFQLSTDNRLFWNTKKPTNTTRLAEQEQRAMSLEAFLRDHRHIDPDDRIRIAVNLASSLLQYNLTPWLKKCWTKNDTYFLTQARSILGVDVEHPLIFKQFHNQDSIRPYDLPENDPELALMELGILLLEIWNMKTFESWLETMGHSIDSSQLHDADVRLKYSIKWFKSVKTKLLPNYCEVVGICLRPAAFDLFDTSWEDAEFRVTVYKKIVEPLLIWGS